ncbi:hypothetical protein WN944_008099 [Citrus x changshan-huyou]|uniref:Uncharacterized protein n=1 Tax=Citrus x changshan-huyou TaxID=2935761 RepID=A0AAP0QYK8_9ROSI
MATGNCRLLVGCGDVPVKDTRGGNGMDEDIRAKEGRMLMLFGQEKRPGSASLQLEKRARFLLAVMTRLRTHLEILSAVGSS